MRALALALVLSALPVSAHDVLGTVIQVDSSWHAAMLSIEIPIDELRRAFGESDAPSGVVPLPAATPELERYVREHLRVTTPERVAFSLDVSVKGTVEHDLRNWLMVDVLATRPAGASAREFVIECDLITHRVLNHRVFVFLRSDVGVGFLGQQPMLLDVLHYQSREARVERPEAQVHRALLAAGRLGLEHVADGADHFAFLLALLLPAGLVSRGRRWQHGATRRQALASTALAVTAFTIGHSIALLASSTGAVAVPGPLVEALIALSVVMCALNAVRPLFAGREAMVTGVFGVVHGLGSATGLAGFGVDGPGRALTVLGFNLGVEAMQLGLVLLVVPCVLQANATVTGRLVRQLLAAALGVVGLVWLGARALHIDAGLPADGFTSVAPISVMSLVAGLLAAAHFGRRAGALSPPARR